MASPAEKPKDSGIAITISPEALLSLFHGGRSSSSGSGGDSGYGGGAKNFFGFNPDSTSAGSTGVGNPMIFGQRWSEGPTATEGTTGPGGRESFLGTSVNTGGGSPTTPNAKKSFMTQ